MTDCASSLWEGGDTMGNIRPTYIKRNAIRLVKEFPQAFTEDFQQNKEMVAKLCDVESKFVRNKIAGYVTRFRKKYIA